MSQFHTLFENLFCRLSPLLISSAPLSDNPAYRHMNSADGWMSALLQKPASLLPKYTASTIGGTDEESAAVMRGTQPYAGMWGIEEGSVKPVDVHSGKEDGDDAGERGYLSKLRKGKRTGWVKFRLYHDIKIGAPVNWIGQKQVRVGEMWEEDEEGEGKDGKRKRLFMSLHADFPVVVEGREWMVAAGWRKRS